MSARRHVRSMRRAESRLDPLGPAALVTRDLGVRSRVLMRFQPGIGEQARRAADAAGVDLTIEVAGDSACFSFARPRSGHETMEGDA